MSLYKTQALVLRSREYAEADCLLTLLTRKKGKVRAIAKGVRKPTSRLRGGVQLFTLNEMLLYEGKSLDIVTQSQCLEGFTLLQESIGSMTAASYWAELLDSVTPEEEVDSEVFNLALAGFHIISLEAKELIIRGLEIKLLSLLGYNPLMETCVSCGGSLKVNEKVAFSTELGGVLCSSCSKKESLYFTREVMQVWQQILRMDLSKLNRIKISGQGMNILDQAIENFLYAQIGHPLKSRPILKMML